MAEELQKYKDILDWERKQFKRQLEREVSTSWFFQIDQRNKILKLNGVRIFATNLAKVIIWFSSKILQCNLSNCIIVLFYYGV